MRKNKIVAALVTLISSSIVAVMSATIAWFSSKVSVTTEDNLTGSSDGAYFAYGDGTAVDNEETLIKEGPYGIETARQLYNLAWLQYLGYFNTPKNGTITPVYFELNADIDMTGWILPPIGTTQYPFIGEFNGNGHTITNLTVSNNFSEILATNKMPSAVRRAEGLSNVNIVGMFGVIGELDNNITATYDSSVTSVSDFTIAGANIKNSLSETLAGIAAGYVNGPLENVAITSRTGNTEIGESADAVISSQITITNANNYSSYDEGTDDKFDNISEYGVVGYCEEAYLDQITNTVVETYNATTDYYDYIAEDQDNENGWGGSMNMLDVYNGIKIKHWDVITSSTNNKRTSIPYKTSETYIYKEDGVTLDDRYDDQGNQTQQGYTYTETYSPDINNVRYYDRHDDDADGYRNTTYSLLIETPENLSDSEWRYMCLTGYGARTVSRGKTVTTTTYYQDQTQYISVGSNFLSANGTTGVRNRTTKTEGTLWIIKNNQIYTTINDNTYYLNASGSSFALSTTASTTWTINSGKISTTVDGATKYIYFVNNSWILGTATPSQYTYYTISNGTGNSKRYLNNNNGTPQSSTTNNNTEWLMDSNRRLYIDNNGTPNYLRYSGGVIIGTDSTTTNAFYRSSSTSNYIQYSNTYYLRDNNGTLARTNSTRNRTSFTFTSNTGTKPAEISVDPVLTFTNDSAKLRYTTTQTNQDSTFYTPDTYIPLKTTKDANKYRTGITDEANTGYIVSGNEYTTDKYGDIRISAFDLSSSLTNSGGANLTTIYTINASGRKTVTSNAANGFSKFDASKNSMITDVLKNNGTARDYVYGMHFMPASIGIEDSNGHIVTVPKAYINGQVYYDYQLPHDCVDFNLKEKGYINFFGGTYYAGNVTHDNNSFFSLYKIERDPASNDISSILRIVEIYEDKNNEARSYIYRLHDDSTDTDTYTLPYVFSNGVKTYLSGATTDELYDGYTSVFDTGWIENPSSYGTLTNYAAYYYEIPMNDGEYALGSVDGMYGAYLMYLDIGANAKKVFRTEIIEYFKWIDEIYSYPRGVFVMAAGTTNASDQNSYCICLKDSYNGTLTMERTTTETTDEAKYTGTGSSDKEAVSYKFPALTLKDDGNNVITMNQIAYDSATTTEIKRFTIYDYNMTTDSVNKIVITDIGNDRTVEKYTNFNIITQTGTEDDDLIIYTSSDHGEHVTKIEDTDDISFSIPANPTKMFTFSVSYPDGSTINITFTLKVTGVLQEAGHYDYEPSGYSYTVTLIRPDGSTQELNAYIFVDYYLNSDGTYTYTFSINDNSITGTTTTPIVVTLPAIEQQQSGD